MIHPGKTDWLHLFMFTMIAGLAGGWLVYYINVSAAEDAEPRYYLYKVLHDEPVSEIKVSDPVSGYGKITVLGKITGDNSATAAINNYLQVDNEYFEKYAGKFVEATGYINEFGKDTPHWAPFGLIIESIKLADINNVDDTGKACKSSADCRYQCVIEAANYEQMCSLTASGNPENCMAPEGKCSSKDLANEDKCTGMRELNGSASNIIGDCAKE